MTLQPEEHESAHSLQEGLKLLKQCPLCKKNYKKSTIKVLTEVDSAYLVHVTCAHCLNAVLAVLMISPMGMSSVGIVTDLSAKDVLRLQDRKPISQDDVIDFHTWLQSNTKSFINAIKAV